METYRAMLQDQFLWKLSLCAFLVFVLLVLLLLSLKVRFLKKNRVSLVALIVAFILIYVPQSIPLIMDWKDSTIVIKEIESYTVETSVHRSAKGFSWKDFYVVAEEGGAEDKSKLWLEVLDKTKVEELSPGGGCGIVVYAEKSNAFLDYFPSGTEDR